MSRAIRFAGLVALLVLVLLQPNVRAGETGGGTTSDVLSTTTLPVSAFPFSVSLRVNCSSLATAQTLWWLGDSTVGTDYCEIRVETTGKVTAAIANLASGEIAATTANTLTTGGWHHVFAMFAAGTTVTRVGLDGGTSVTAAGTTPTPATPNKMALFLRDGLVLTNPSSATLQDVAIWSTRPSSQSSFNRNEALLNAGAGPRGDVNFGSTATTLVAWFPLDGRLVDIVGHFSLTSSGTITATSSVPVQGGNQ